MSDAAPTSLRRLFDLPLGSHFRYPDTPKEPGSTFVLIGYGENGLVCDPPNSRQLPNGRPFQGLYSAADSRQEFEALQVELVQMAEAPISPHDARRVAACLKACDGVATEWLEREADGVVVLGEPIAGRFKAMEAQIERMRLGEEGAREAYGHIVEQKNYLADQCKRMRSTIDAQQGVIQRLQAELRQANQKP